MSDSFHIMLPSNSSMDRFPANTTANFITNLRNPIKLEGEWEMCLLEFHYPHTCFNVFTGHNKISIKIDYFKSAITKDMVLYIKPGLYQTKSALVKTVNDELEKVKVGKLEFLMNDTVHFTPAPKDEEIHVQEVILCTDLAKQLGYAPKSNLVEFPISSAEADISHGFPTHIYVYCDLIEGQYVGDTIAPILRMINTEYQQYKYGANVTKSFASLQYVPLLKLEFSTVEIDLRDYTGNLIPFGGGHSAVTIHFRRRRRNQY
jgi:hypothetical protein